MSTYTISGTYAKTFVFRSPYTELSITRTGYVEVPEGLTAIRSGTTSGAYTVANYGRVAGTVYLGDGGLITNGSAALRSASITTYPATQAIIIDNAPGTVANYGLISAYQPAKFSAEAVVFGDGGLLVNGNAADTTATVRSSYRGVVFGSAPGTVANFGSIVGLGVTGIHDSAIYAPDGAMITNGTGVDTTALIAGASGVDLGSAAGGVVNFGTILAFGTSNGLGTRFGQGTLTNGSATDTEALIEGYNGGVLASAGPSVIANFGTIESKAASNSAAAIALASGTLSNGASSDRTALISGYEGVQVDTTVVTNDGTMRALGTTGHGIELAGGSLQNGSVVNPDALIEGGYLGVALIEATGSNYGTIISTATQGARALYLNSGDLTNGGHGQTHAMVEGYIGAVAVGASVLDNYGTIEGLDGAAVELKSSKAVLVAEAGAVFHGTVTGGGGTLALGAGTGTLTGLLSAGGNVTVSGDMPTTTFRDFGALRIDKGAAFSLSGAGTIGAGQALIDDGSLAVASMLSSAGAVTLAGTLSGTGTLAVTAGSLVLGAGTRLILADVTVSGASTTVGVATSLSYAGKWRQSGGILAVAKSDTLTLANTADSFSGTMNGAGAVVVAGELAIGAAGATLSGGGVLQTTNSAANIIVGATGAATLTNAGDRILGAGQLGDGTLTLVNKAGGVIIGDDSVALVINTAAVTIQNAGEIGSDASGGTHIVSPITNTGLLFAATGTLTVSGPVAGSGSVRVGAGGVADFASAFTQNVAFTATSGTLELAHSQAYAGQVSGFSKTGGTAFDLLDIAFKSGTTKASFSGTATGGTLTVTDATHAAKIALVGDYLSSTFTVASDGHGGTTVVDPSGAARGALPHRFIATAAGFGAPSGGAMTAFAQSADRLQWGLAGPRAQLA